MENNNNKKFIFRKKDDTTYKEEEVEELEFKYKKKYDKTIPENEDDELVFNFRKKYDKVVPEDTENLEFNFRYKKDELPPLEANSSSEDEITINPRATFIKSEPDEFPDNRWLVENTSEEERRMLFYSSMIVYYKIKEARQRKKERKYKKLMKTKKWRFSTREKKKDRKNENRVERLFKAQEEPQKIHTEVVKVPAQPEFSIGMNYKRAKELNFNEEVLGIIKNGWLPEVLPHEKCLNLDNNLSAKKWASQTTEEIKNLLFQERIEEVTGREELIHDINPLTMIYKPGKWRLCIDTSRIVNKTIPSLPFKQRGIHHRLKKFRKGSWMCKIDLKNGYLHIPLHEDFRKFVCFKWNNKIYRYKWLPFGLNDAPRVFQAIANEVSLSLLRDGFMVENYLDDFWIEGETKEKCQEAVNATLKRLAEIGFTTNFKKSSLVPSQEMEYLGMIFNTQKGEISLKESAIENIKKSFKNALKNSTAKNIQKLMGFIASALTIDHRLKPFTMATYRQLGGRQGDQWVYWNKEARAEIRELISLLKFAKYRAENSFKEQKIITSDASKKGFAFWDDKSNEDTVISWDSKAHSTYTELIAATTALKERSEENCFNIIRTDNTTTRDILLSGSSKKPKLNKLVKKINIWMIKNNIFFTARYIQGKLNTRADELSRRKELKITSKNQPPGGIELDIIPTITQSPTLSENIKESIKSLPNDVQLKQRKLFEDFPIIRISNLITLPSRKIDKLYRKLLRNNSLEVRKEFFEFIRVRYRNEKSFPVKHIRKRVDMSHLTY